MTYLDKLNDLEREQMFDKTTPISDYDLRRRYDDMLDDTYSVVTIGNLTYMPSDVLKAVDPVAYDCGYHEWTEADYIEYGGDYYSKQDLEDAAEAYVQRRWEREQEQQLAYRG